MEQIIEMLNTQDMPINDNQDFDNVKKIALFQEQLINLNEQYRDLKKNIKNKNKITDMRQYMRNYYHTKEKHVTRDNYVCDVCNCSVKYHSKAVHLKSKKHLKAITQPQQ